MNIPGNNTEWKTKSSFSQTDTKETQIQIELSLDGVGKGEISTEYLSWIIC